MCRNRSDILKAFYLEYFENITQIEKYNDVLKKLVTNDENDFFLVIELHANFVENSNNVEFIVNFNLTKSSKSVF